MADIRLPVNATVHLYYLYYAEQVTPINLPYLLRVVTHISSENLTVPLIAWKCDEIMVIFSLSTILSQNLGA